MKWKIIIPMTIIVIVMATMTIAFSAVRFSEYTGVLFDEMLNVSAEGVKLFISDCETASRTAAISASESREVISAVRNRDPAAIIRALKSMNLYGVDFFTVTDEMGYVLARTHDGKLGDSVLNQENIRQALNKSVYTCIEEGTVVKASVRTGAPIFDTDGTIIGVVSTGVRLDTNKNLDYLKEHYQADFTIFLGNVRIATTVENDGERILGTPLNPTVEAIIMSDKKEHLNYAEIDGEMYNAYYIPLIDDHDNVYAILAVGQPISNLLTERSTMIRNLILIGLVGLVLAISTVSIVVTRLSRPIDRLVNIVSEVTQGNIYIEIDTTNVPTDEIGKLTHDIHSLVKVLQSTTDDLSLLTRDLTLQGGSDYQIDTSKYAGSYREIVQGIQTLAHSVHMMRKTMAAMDYLDTMVSVTDLDYNLLFVNQRMADEYNLDKETCIGQKCYKAIRKLDGPCAVCQMSRLVDDKDSYPSIDYENQYDEVSGSYIGGRAAIIQWVDGTHAFLNSIKDETLKIQYQERLRETAAAAEAASVAKSSFLANMSHEIRTPMNSIIGFSELAMDEELTNKSRDYLTLIIENSQWLLGIINDILDLSKVESGKMELEITPFNLRELVSRCKAVVLAKAIEKNIDLQFVTEAAINKMVCGDPTRLRQVLENLITNAVKFTNRGGVKLSVTLEEETEKHLKLRFAVSDSGIGLTQEQKTRIFEPFMQADISTTRKYGGSGLGLPIAKNLIELMGGELEIDSELGVGTTASFTLALEIADMSDVPEENNKLNKVERPMFEGNVLVCEDNPMNQRVIFDHLSRVGLDVEIVENGWKGVESVQRRVDEGEKPFDLIFMDIHMPVMDGIEATSKIMKLGTGTPIVAMTANIMTDDRERYKSLGMSNCVGKPFTSQELWKCLLTHIKQVGSTTFDTDGNDNNGNVELLNLLRTDFVTSNQTKIYEISSALADGDITLAHRLVHTLKSNAGYIGMTALQKTAADVEMSLKGGENRVTSKQMNALRLNITEALDELAPYMDPAPDAAQHDAIVPVYDIDIARAIINKVEPLLKRGNPECLKFIDDLQMVPGSGEVIVQMKEFYFGNAAKLLSEVKKSLEEEYPGA